MAKNIFREIFNHQIESTESAGRLTLRLFEDRKILIIEQNGKVYINRPLASFGACNRAFKHSQVSQNGKGENQC